MAYSPTSPLRREPASDDAHWCPYLEAFANALQGFGFMHAMSLVVSHDMA